MNAASIDRTLVEMLVHRARRLISIKCYAEAGQVLDFLHSQLKYGVME